MCSSQKTSLIGLSTSRVGPFHRNLDNQCQGPQDPPNCALNSPCVQLPHIAAKQCQKGSDHHDDCFQIAYQPRQFWLICLAQGRKGKLSFLSFVQMPMARGSLLFCRKTSMMRTKSPWHRSEEGAEKRLGFLETWESCVGVVGLLMFLAIPELCLCPPL